MLTTLKLFNFYRRYKWNEVDFGVLQDSLIGFPSTLLAALSGDAVLSGLNQNGFSSLNANYLSGVAINSLGNILAVSANGSIAVADNVKSLVVIRPSTINDSPITRPTAPFDTVSLDYEQSSSVVAIAGTISAYPAKVAGDVILFGVTSSGGVITQIDESQCELIGKVWEINTERVVGNHRECHYLDLATALAAMTAGARLRVRDSQVLDATVASALNNIDIKFDPNVTFSAGIATIGFSFSGDGVKFINGRVTGFITGINLTGNYNSILNTRFATNTTDVADALATSTQVGVISE